MPYYFSDQFGSSCNKYLTPIAYLEAIALWVFMLIAFGLAYA